MSAVRNDPKLWEEVKKECQGDKRWNARIAQQAVLLYKKRGGTYSKSVPKSKTDLKKWTDEDWKYVSKDSKRYLPKKVIDSLTPKEKKEASESKKKLGKNYKYPDSINKKMKSKKIY